MVPLVDGLHRPLQSLRVSVTDQCNLRCQYCMPEAHYTWLPRPDLLRADELARLVGVFATLGVERVRLTGGEPLLRQDLPDIVARIARLPGIRDLALTTNGVCLANLAAPLHAAGLHRLTVSLDTLQAARFQALTRMAQHAAVLRGIDAAAALPFTSLKLDTVVLRGVNDDELVSLLAFATSRHAELRFIEYMDVGGATRWTPAQVVSRREILERLTAHYGLITPLAEKTSAPAERFQLPDGTIFGIVASMTTPFCRRCDRSRLTADGVWFLCLYAAHGTNLREPLRAGASDDDLREVITATWQARVDRGAELRWAAEHRSPLLPVSVLQHDAHLEMHTRGG